MKRFKVFGALLSAAALIVSMPLTAFGGGSDKVETISTSGWVQVSNALPQKGDVISMTISLPAGGVALSEGGGTIKGISGWMQSVEGATPVLGPESTAAPSAAATPSATPTPSATATATAAPTPAVSPTQDTTPAPTETEDPVATSSAEGEETPSGDGQEEGTETSSPNPGQEESTKPETPGNDEGDPADPDNSGNTEDPDNTGTGSEEGVDPDNPAEGDEDGSDPSGENAGTETGDAENEDDGNSDDPESSDNAGSETALERDPDKGWMGLLSEEDLFIVLGPAEETNSAKRFFQITADPGKTVRFEFTGRYSDGNGDHLFRATHEFKVAEPGSKTTNRISVNTGSVRTVDGSSLNFRVWPTDLTTIEGVRASSAVQNGTSPGELLRNLSLPAKTTARVYRGSTNVPRLSGVCTGDTVRFASTARGAGSEAVAVVRGDLLGTGKLSLNQLVAMSKTLAGQFPLDEASLQAADVNGDGAVTPADATALKKLVLARK